MTGIEESFALLEIGDLIATAETLVTRGTEVKSTDGEVLVALDVDGARHLLIPYRMRTKGRVEGALSFRSRELGDPPRPHLDLVCTRRELDGIFAAFCEHVLSVLDDSTDAQVTVRRAVDEWKDLLRAGAGLSDEVAIGLIGELDILVKLAAKDPMAAWDSWTGHLGHVHDFTAVAAELEVKATSVRDSGGVQIHGLDQLDPGDRPLYLLVHRMAPDPAAPTLDERLDHLVSMGVPRHELLTVVTKMGHTYASGQVQHEHRYCIRSTQAWAVGENSPGLRRSRLEAPILAGVSRVRYTLAVDALPAPVGASEYTALLEEFLSE